MKYVAKHWQYKWMSIYTLYIYESEVKKRNSQNKNSVENEKNTEFVRITCISNAASFIIEKHVHLNSSTLRNTIYSMQKYFMCFLFSSFCAFAITIRRIFAHNENHSMDTEQMANAVWCSSCAWNINIRTNRRNCLFFSILIHFGWMNLPLAVATVAGAVAIRHRIGCPHIRLHYKQLVWSRHTNLLRPNIAVPKWNKRKRDSNIDMVSRKASHTPQKLPNPTSQVWIFLWQRQHFLFSFFLFSHMNPYFSTKLQKKTYAISYLLAALSGKKASPFWVCIFIRSQPEMWKTVPFTE